MQNLRHRRELPTLDLHGNRLNHAIRRLTDFLEAEKSRTTTQVLVITGTGSHSWATGGPVLRGAVEDLLHRRHIEFVRDTPGSLIVQCQTGITFLKHEDSSGDSKIRIESAESESVRLQLAEKRRLMQQHSNGSVSSSSSSRNGDMTTGCPSLAEVAREEADLESGKKESLELARQSQSERQREQNEYNRVVDLSINAEREEQQREHKILQQALELSKQHTALARKNDEQQEHELLRQTLALSKQFEASEREVHEQRENQLLQQAIVLSKEQQETEREEDEVLRQVLAMSQQQDCCENDENRMLELAFQQSMTLSLSASGNMETDATVLVLQLEETRKLKSGGAHDS